MIACKDCPMMECINRTALGGCGGFGPVAEPIMITSNHETKVEFKTDWEQIRIQAAIAAMQGILSNPEHRLDYDNSVGDNVLPAIAIVSIKQADVLIEELKKEK